MDFHVGPTGRAAGGIDVQVAGRAADQPAPFVRLGGAGSEAGDVEGCAEAYVEPGRLFVAPVDPEDEGYTMGAGDAWLNPDDLTAVPGRLLAFKAYEPGAADNKTTT